MSELRNRLERLATRGSRRGADDVLAAARRSAPREEIGVVPDYGTDLPIIDDDIVPFVSAEPETRRRSRYGTVVAAFGIAALLGVGMLAITAVFGNGGASSPEGAVRQLADAVAHKDPLAAVDVLSPSEIRSARQTVSDATHRAADLKVVDDASQPLAGVDLSVDNLKLSTETLAEGYAKVTITGGEITATTHTAAMSKLLQQAIKNSGNQPGKVELAKLASDSNLPTFVVTVRHDGRWYVSPAYTALEYARESDGGAPAEFGSAAAKIATLGSDTPDNAVGDALRAWQAGDWDHMMALVPPDELPVYDYRAWIDQAAAATHPDFTIDKLSTTSTVSGDSATVKLEASGTTGSGSDKGKWQVGGTCPTETIDSSSGTSESFSPALVPDSGAVKGLGENGGGVYSTSSGAVAEQTFTPSFCLSGDLGQAVPFGLFPFGSGDPAQSSGAVSIKVVRESGRWFVSPVTTVLDTLDSTIQQIDQRTVYTVLGLAYQLPPDGTITLDQPFTVPSESGLLASSVFAFDGTKGQKIVGESNGSNNYASGEVYTAAGKEVDYVEFSPKDSGFGYSITLPSTGSYRMVITGFTPKGDTLTLWDAKNAPKGLIAPDSGISSGVSGGTCTYTHDSETCTSAPITGPVTALTPSESTGSSSSTPPGSGSSSRSVTATTSPVPTPTVPVPKPAVGVATSVP